MEALTTADGANAKRELMREYTDRLCDAMALGSGAVGDNSVGGIGSSSDALRAALVLALPLDGGRVFGLRDRRLLRLLPRLLSPTRRVDSDSASEGQRFMHLADAATFSGDMSVVIEAELASMARGDTAARPSLSLRDVDAALDAVASASSDAAIEAALHPLFARASPREGKWLIRLLQRNLRTGAQAAVLIPLLDTDSTAGSTSKTNGSALERYRAGMPLVQLVDTYWTQRASSVASSRGSSCGAVPTKPDTVSRGGDGIFSSAAAVESQGPLAPQQSDVHSDCSGSMSLLSSTSGASDAPTPVTHPRPPLPSRAMTASVGSPLRPQLAVAARSPLDAWERAHGPANGVVAAEVKYDGQRVQVHYGGSERVVFYSRSGQRVAPEVTAGLDAAVCAALPSVTSAVLDAELLLLDGPSGRALPFGSLGKYARSAYGASAHPTLFVFDVLALNGASLLDISWRQRRQALASTLVQQPAAVYASAAFAPTTVSELTLLDAAARAAGLEGLMVKDVDAPYEAGARRWVKLKVARSAEGSETVDGNEVPLLDTVDLVVLGAYYGRGARGGGAHAAWLLGARDDATTAGVGSPQWRTVARVGTGFSAADRIRITASLAGARLRSGDAPPSWLSVASSLTPDWVVADPSAAPVWEIAAAGLTPSQSHTARVSLRFPVLKRERPDKDTADATTVSQLQAAFEAGGVSGRAVAAAAAAAASAAAQGCGAASSTASLASPMAPDSTCSSSSSGEVSDPVGGQSVRTEGKRPPAGALLRGFGADLPTINTFAPTTDRIGGSPLDRIGGDTR